MSIILIGRPKKNKRLNGGYEVHGFAYFSGVTTTGELPIDSDCRNLDAMPIITPAGALDGGTSDILAQDSVGTISASGAFLFRAPATGVVSSLSFTVDTTVATDAANIWTIGVINHSNADAVVANIATAANSNNSTGGSAFTADTARALTLTSTTADKTVTVGDVLEWTFTKAASGANLVELSLFGAVTPTAGYGIRERVYVDESSLIAAVNAESYGLLKPAFNTTISPKQYSITISRQGTNPTSGLKFGYHYQGVP